MTWRSRRTGQLWQRRGPPLPKASAPIVRLGHMLVFFFRAVVAVPVALRHYRGEFVRLLSDIAWGNGSLVVGGGTAGVAIVLGITVGALVGIEGYNFLDLLGLGPATGIISSLVNTRELAPIAASLAFATQAGCRFTAQLGSMRIAEEIDALDSLAIRPIPYLVTTRLMASVVAAIPLYVACLAVSYLTSQFIVHDHLGRFDRLLHALFRADAVGARHRLLIAQGDHLRLDCLDDPVLLRLLCRGRSRRRGSCCGTCHAGQHHGSDHRQHADDHGAVDRRLRRKVRRVDVEFARPGRPRTLRSAAAWLRRRAGAVAGIVAGLLLVKATGRLDPYIRVVADLVNVGDGLPQRSDVKYHGVLVGVVNDVTPAAHGTPNFVHIDLNPEYATSIPATVTARVVPSNVFAVSSVQLVDRGPGAADQRRRTHTRGHRTAHRAVPDHDQQATRHPRRDRAGPRGQDGWNLGRGQCRHPESAHRVAHQRRPIEPAHRRTRRDRGHRAGADDRVGTHRRGPRSAADRAGTVRLLAQGGATDADPRRAAQPSSPS